MQQYFVTFLSPGTFFDEETTLPIERWDVLQAVEMSKTIVERYEARPYGFYFTTRGREENELDSKEIDRSFFYFLSGTVWTFDQLIFCNHPSDRILISNMQHGDEVVITFTPWKHARIRRFGDVILED